MSAIYKVMKRPYQDFCTHRRMIIITGAFRPSRLLSISYWLLARKPKAKSQEPIADLLKNQTSNNQSVEKI